MDEKTFGIINGWKDEKYRFEWMRKWIKKFK